MWASVMAEYPAVELCQRCRALIGSSIDNIFGFDRGQHRENNDRTLDS
jgi:hypothetical protein